MLPSFLLLSYIVAPKRILVNTSSFNISIQIISWESFKDIVIDMKISTSRDWFVFTSTNNFKVLLVYSNIFSMVYTEHV